MLIMPNPEGFGSPCFGNGQREKTKKLNACITMPSLSPKINRKREEGYVNVFEGIARQTLLYYQAFVSFFFLLFSVAGVAN